MTHSTDRYQPYFVAYATAHGVTPAAMASRTDSLRNVDFMTWIGARWAEFRALRPDCFTVIGATPDGHAAFGVWLAARGDA